MRGHAGLVIINSLPLNVLGLTSEVSVVEAHMRLTIDAMGLQPTCFILVCVRHEPPGPNSYARLRISFLAGFCRDPLYMGGLM